MDAEIANLYGNKVRVRACGLCRQAGKLLLVNHSGINETAFWAPPGGGVDFSVSIQETIQKEFLEETNLTVAVGSFAFGTEFVRPPLHAIELFYEVSITGGHLSRGFDPELNIIREAAFFSDDEILSLPLEQLHGIFRHYAASNGLRDLKGFYTV
jgi:8-oxo-dGTP diphosphatase